MWRWKLRQTVRGGDDKIFWKYPRCGFNDKATSTRTNSDDSGKRGLQFAHCLRRRSARVFSSVSIFWDNSLIVLLSFFLWASSICKASFCISQ